MIYVSMMEMLTESRRALSVSLGDGRGTWAMIAAFFGGILLVAVIDRLVPSYENPHELHDLEELSDAVERTDGSLLRMGIFSAIAIAVHNFPEGMATFAASLRDLHVGIPIAAAIAIHNIPEGIAVSVPIYYATGNRNKALWYSFLSGLAEPAGALVGFFLLSSFLNDATFGVMFALVAGIMVFISFDELLPAAEKYGKHHWAVYGLLLGMFVMAVSLALF
jgi:ZIP family zinc transporter